MKIAVVFLVVVVSSCHGIGLDAVGNIVPGLGKTDLPPIADVLNICLIKDLKESAILLLRLAVLICTYDKGMDQLNDENWKAVLKSLKEVLIDTTCAVSVFLGKIDALEKLGEPIANIVGSLVMCLRPVLDATGLSEMVFKTACDLTTKFLKPTCLPLLIGGDVPKLLIDLKVRACPEKNAKIAIDDIKDIVKRLSCLFTDTGPLDDIEVNNIVSYIPTNDLGSLTSSKPASLLCDLIISVLCSLVDILLPLPRPYVYGVGQEVADQKVLEDEAKAKSPDSTPAVVRIFSALKGQCGCFDFSGHTIVYKPANVCDSMLLCRMFHNIAIVHGLHLTMAGNFMTSFPVVPELHNTKPIDDIDFKNMNISCLSKLLQKDVPSSLKKLHDLLCVFQQGKDEHNEALYKEFLTQMNIAFKNVGCSLDDVLTMNILERITDNAGKIADRLVFEILKIADDLKVTGQLLNVVCELLGKTLSNLRDILGNVGLEVKKIDRELLG